MVGWTYGMKSQASKCLKPMTFRGGGVTVCNRMNVVEVLRLLSPLVYKRWVKIIANIASVGWLGCAILWTTIHAWVLLNVFAGIQTADQSNPPGCLKFQTFTQLWLYRILGCFFFHANRRQGTKYFQSCRFLCRSLLLAFWLDLVFSWWYHKD